MTKKRVRSPGSNRPWATRLTCTVTLERCDTLGLKERCLGINWKFVTEIRGNRVIKKPQTNRARRGRGSPVAPYRFRSMAKALIATVVFFGLLAVAQQTPAAETDNPRQLFEEAYKAQQQGNAALAVRKYQELLRTHPEVVSARANLAAALVSLGRFDDAIAQYEEALKQLPGNPDLRFSLALAYYRKGDYTEAGRRFASLNWDDPKNLRVATLLADCDLRLGRNEQAVELLTPLEKKQPDNLDIAWVLGRALIGAGHTREGLERVQKFADATHNVEAYQLAANLYLGLTYFDKARSDAEAVIRLNPRMPQAYVVLGMVEDYSGDEEHAEQQFRKALTIDPNDLQARLQLASVLYNQRKLAEAREQLTRALALDPKSASAHYLLARVERTQGNLQAAVEQLKTAAQENPKWLAPHVDLVALYYALKQPAEGAREKKIVDDLMTRERQQKDATRVILPRVPAP